MDILQKLTDLHLQATTDRSHFYVGSCVKEAIREIMRLREEIRDIKFNKDELLNWAEKHTENNAISYKKLVEENLSKKLNLSIKKIKEMSPEEIREHCKKLKKGNKK